MSRRKTILSKRISDIPLEWNMYNEGFRMFGIQDKRFKLMEGLRVARVNHAIWRINKEMDKLLVQKVTAPANGRKWRTIASSSPKRPASCASSRTCRCSFRSRFTSA